MLIIWKDAFGEKKSFYLSKLLAMNLDNYVNGVMNKTTSAVFIVDGRSGLGKTTLSMQLGCYINNKVKEIYKKKGKEKECPKFTLDNVCWTPETFIDILKDKDKKLKKGDIVILDESMIISSRTSMSEINKAVIIMMSLIRSKQLFIIFCANSFFDLDKNLSIHRADLLINLYPKGGRFADRGAYQVIPSNKGQMKNLYIIGKKYYDYSKARAAFNDTFSAWFPFDENEYEKRKQESISEYFDSDKKGRADNATVKSRDLLIAYILKKFPSMTQNDISRIADISVRTITRAMQKYRDKEFELM